VFYVRFQDEIILFPSDLHESLESIHHLNLPE